MKVRHLVITLALVIAIVGVQLPSVSGQIASASNGGEEKTIPKTHTIDKDGALHAPGLDTPETKCAACHGKDLKGGKKAGSCFDCHEKNW
jgi:cytochrome c553